MKTGVQLVTAGLLLALCMVLPALAQASVSFETVEKGEISYYRYSDPDFEGADLVIRDKKNWEWFWSRHTAGITPSPPVPDINFGRDMVIVSILGYHTSGGGPAIDVFEVKAPDHRLHVLIEDNKTPGPLTVITNPFHIIKLRNINAGSEVFEHQKP